VRFPLRVVDRHPLGLKPWYIIAANLSHPRGDHEDPASANMRGTVLRGLEDVHKRPGMYIGDTDDGSGLHRMLFAVVDNAINEALAGHCSRVEVVLNAGGSATVRDNGRGIPTDIHPREGVSAAEIIMTRLGVDAFPQGTRPPGARNVADALHGVAMAVVNALSEVLDLHVWRNGKEHFMRCRMGEPDAPIAVVGTADELDGNRRRGTEITLLPSSKIFSKTEFDFTILEHRLRGLAFLNVGVTVVLSDRRGIESKQVLLDL
jgi:DNA gyrase subunit B